MVFGTRGRVVRTFELNADTLSSPLPLLTIIKVQATVGNTLDTIERPGREVTKPVLDTSVANWLALHGFDFEAVRAQHRGAFIWYWRITRHSDPHRPRKAVDVPLHCSDLRHMEIRVGRMWPNII